MEFEDKPKIEYLAMHPHQILIVATITLIIKTFILTQVVDSFWIVDCTATLAISIMIWKSKFRPFALNRFSVSPSLVISITAKSIGIFFGFILAIHTGKLLTIYITEVFPLLAWNRIGISYKDALPSNSYARIFVIFYASLSAGILEEIVYRGTLLHTNIEEKYRLALIAIASILFFTLIHAIHGMQSTIAALSAGIFSTMLILIFNQKSTLFSLIITHSAVDFIWLNGK